MSIHGTATALLISFALQTFGAVAILEESVHLGFAGKPEWSVFAEDRPEGTNLVRQFDAPLPHSNEEQTLLIRQDDVKQDWFVTLNGLRLGRLVTVEAPLVHSLPVPAGLLKARENRLEIGGRAADDILLHEITLFPAPKAELFTNLLSVEVREAGRAGEFPCRITILDERGHLAAFHDFGATNIAARPGVVYTGTGRAKAGLRPGAYTVYATRGSEYGVEGKTVRVPEQSEVRLSIARQVDTSGWIASDTHLHTLSLSRHGDALLHERAITLAAEGLELPVVTEHNQHADYADTAKALGLARYFTTVPGNEVTTRKGHFNIFPVSLDAPPPDHTNEDWTSLFKDIRATPKVEVAIINHPTDVHAGFVPFAATNLNLVTGRNLRGDFNFPFDAMEVINSGAMNSDWMAPFRAWFALLNRGYRTVAVASSDSHDVSRFIAGQGRTYIRGDDSNPGAIDVSAACENLKQGRAVVSLGIFTHLEIREGGSDKKAAGPGEMIFAADGELDLIGSYSAPDWIRPNRAVIYANGWQLHEQRMEGSGIKSRGSVNLRLAVPKQDTQFVLIVEAPGVTNQFWATARPYQPSTPEWEPVMIGATNPVWLDANGDGEFTSPHDYARKLGQLPLDELLAKLASYDWATAAQVAEVLHLEKKMDLRSREITADLPEHVRKAFSDYLAAAR